MMALCLLKRGACSVDTTKNLIVTTSRLAALNYHTTLRTNDGHSQVYSLSKPTTGYQIRSLFTDEALGIRRLEDLRRSKSSFYGASGASERYVQRLKEFLDQGRVQSLFLDDINNMVGIANCEDHYDIIDRLAETLKSDANASIDVTGVNIMRLYLMQDQVDRALENIKDSTRFGKTFSLLTTYQIVMTALYRSGRYQDVLELFEVAKERLDLSNGGNASRRLTVIVVASLAKICTPEAVEMAEKLYREDENNMVFKKRMVIMIAYMSTKLGRYADCLNWLSTLATPRYITIRELKIIALIKLDRFEDLEIHLRDSISNSQGQFSLLTASSHALLQQSLDRVHDEALRQSLEDILVETKTNNLVNMDSTVEDLVFSPIRPRLNPMFDQARKQIQYSGRGQTSFEPTRLAASRNFATNRQRRVIPNRDSDDGY